jgi:hypothetical protein
LVFITEKLVVEMFKLSNVPVSKLSTKPTKEKEKEKEAVVYRKIIPSKTLVD